MTKNTNNTASKNTKLARSIASIFEPLEGRQMYSATAAPAVMGYLQDSSMAWSQTNSGLYVDSNNVTHDTLNWNNLKQVDYFSMLPNLTAGSTAYNNGNETWSLSASQQDSIAAQYAPLGWSQHVDGTLQSTSASGCDPVAQLALIHSEIAKANSNAKVFVSIGGGSQDEIYDMDALINTPSAYTTFAQNLGQFAAANHVDGIDMDWEPTGQAHFTVSQSQINNFSTLLADIKAANPNLKLTADVLGEQSSLTSGGSAFELNSTGVAAVDSVNVMAYPIDTVSYGNTVMNDWSNYLKNMQQPTTKLQYGLDVMTTDGDTSNTTASMIDQKVDAAAAGNYGGMFIWELDGDINNTMANELQTRWTADTAIVTQPTAPVVPATVTGSVTTADGSAVSGVTVYLDLNNNKTLDSNEQSTTSSTTGSFTFSNVPIGETPILRQVLPTGDTQVTPSNGLGLHLVTTTAGQTQSNQNFIDTVPTPVTTTPVTTAPWAQLTGKIIGTANNASAFLAFDGNTATSYVGWTAENNWIGLDLGSVMTVHQIKFAANSNNPWDMEGGCFQIASNADFSDATTVYTVGNTTTPSNSLTTVNVDASARYVRYVAPKNAEGTIAELQVFGY